MRRCDNCGKDTENPRFCSRSCSAKMTNKENPKRKIKRKCSKCNNIVRTYRQTLCNEHFEEWKLRFQQECTVGEYREKQSVKGKHPSWLHSHIRNFARSWLKELKKLPCANCGYDKHVELAHIKSVKDFDDDAKLSEVNNIKNLIQLCPNCHWEFDNLDRKIFTELLAKEGKNSL